MDDDYKTDSPPHQSQTALNIPIEIRSEIPVGILGELFDDSCYGFSIPVTILPNDREKIIHSINCILGNSETEINEPVQQQTEPNS